MATFLRKGKIGVARCSSVPLTIGKSNNEVAIIRKKVPLNSARTFLSPSTLTSLLPTRAQAVASCGISIPRGCRHYHSDVAKVPSFDDYRLSSNKDPKANTFQSEMDRKFYLYSMALGPGINAKQAGKAEVKLDTIPEGKNLVIKWRNKPLFIRHRTEEEVARERAVPLTALRDPERDEDRVVRDKWLICLGICTHLGCIPLANSGDYAGGYYCPCHGSHYDASGRIRRGPAPKNLEVPVYEFASDDLVVVG